MSDLLQATLNRQAIHAAMTGQPMPEASATSTSSTTNHAGGIPRSPLLGYRSGGEHSEDDSDDALTPVCTRPSTPAPSSSKRRGLHIASSTSASRSTSPSRLAKKRLAEEAERKTSTDPLRRFDNAISTLIFRELDVPDLSRAMRVCKRWHRSATINWAWYLRFQQRRTEDAFSSEPMWTRREAKENWSQRYRSAFSLNGLQYQTAFEAEYEKARSDGYRTPKEQREGAWAAEAADKLSISGQSGNLHTVFGGDKQAAREFYKGLGGRSKIKSKSHAMGPKDRTGFSDGYDDY